MLTPREMCKDTSTVQSSEYFNYPGLLPGAEAHISFMIVSANLHIDIAIHRGRDKARYDDKAGCAFVDFAGASLTTFSLLM